MENLSRVSKYHELRKKIENMDLYSYYEKIDDQPKQNDELTNVPLFNYDHIKKNTLSISVNELLEQKSNNSEAQMIKTELVKKKAKKVKKQIDTKKLLLWLLIGGLCLVLVILIIVLIAMIN